MSAARRLPRRWALGAALALAPIPLAGQAYGYLAGTVVDDLTGAPLVRAVVSIVGTELRAETDGEGRFLLEGVAGGEQLSLRIGAEGYGSVVEPVEISPVEVGLIQVRLRPIAAVLDDLLVVGRAQPAEGPEAVPVRGENDGWRSALDLLEHGVPGVRVGRQPGQVGADASIRIRGVSSLQGDLAPAIYVDGVRIGGSGGLDAASLLDGLPAETVARIRVLRGPAAASPYGFAANGVILIETRRGGGAG